MESVDDISREVRSMNLRWQGGWITVRMVGVAARVMRERMNSTYMVKTLKAEIQGWQINEWCWKTKRNEKNQEEFINSKTTMNRRERIERVDQWMKNGKTVEVNDWEGKKRNYGWEDRKVKRQEERRKKQKRRK